MRRIERFTRQPVPVGVIEGFEPKRSAPAARAGARPGWKPGDGRTAAKPAQRSFGKPAGAREGGYGERTPREPYAPRADRAPSESRYADRGPREGYAPRPQGDRPAAAARAPREGQPQGQRREGGYKGAHPRSMDGARRSFGE